MVGKHAIFAMERQGLVGKPLAFVAPFMLFVALHNISHFGQGLDSARLGSVQQGRST
jgi:hypothetical protein